MKFYQSKVVNNLGMIDQQSFDPTSVVTNPTKNIMRGISDMYLIWKTIEYFKPTTLLEIGSYAGQTLGIMLESAGSGAKLTSVDINFTKLKVFQHLFPHNEIEFIETDSLDLNLDRKFDFIHVDGDHNHPWVENDVIKSLEMSHQNTIISVDDYEKNWTDVPRVIKNYLCGQNDFVPFLMGDQSMFFHHVSHSSDEFLDYWIQNDARNFINFSNENFFNGFRVLKTSFISHYALTSDMPRLNQDHLELFIRACNFYKL
jgi:SAM-dependent methyltransferase